jgi:hypothetical protein
MFRPTLILPVLALFAAPAAAATYSAKLAVPTAGRIIARDIAWNCGADACRGATQEGRPVLLCQSLSKRAGKVETFLVDGRAFTSAQLDTCNASAKAASNKALAAQ